MDSSKDSSEETRSFIMDIVDIGRFQENFQQLLKICIVILINISITLKALNILVGTTVFNLRP